MGSFKRCLWLLLKSRVPVSVSKIRRTDTRVLTRPGPCVKCIDLHNHSVFITILTIQTFLYLTDEDKFKGTVVTVGGGLDGNPGLNPLPKPKPFPCRYCGGQTGTGSVCIFTVVTLPMPPPRSIKSEPLGVGTRHGWFQGLPGGSEGQKGLPSPALL